MTPIEIKKYYELKYPIVIHKKLSLLVKICFCPHLLNHINRDHPNIFKYDLKKV